jgi:hypothetical protein
MQHAPSQTKYEYLKHHNLRPQCAFGLKALMEMDIIKEYLIHHFSPQIEKCKQKYNESNLCFKLPALSN